MQFANLKYYLFIFTFLKTLVYELNGLTLFLEKWNLTYFIFDFFRNIDIFEKIKYNFSIHESFNQFFTYTNNISI